MSSSSDDDIFVLEVKKPTYKNAHIYEGNTSKPLKKDLSPSRKTSKKRKRKIGEINTNVKQKMTAVKRRKKTIKTNSINPFKQGSEKMLKNSENSDFANERSSMDVEVIEEITKKTNLKCFPEMSSPNKGKKVIGCSKITDFLKPVSATSKDQSSSEKKQSSLSNETCDDIEGNLFNEDFEPFDCASFCETNLEIITDTNKGQDLKSSEKDEMTVISERTKHTKVNDENSKLLCDILKAVVCDVMTNQINLDNKNYDEGKTVEKLLSNEETSVVNKYFLLTENCSKLYVRMLCRKKDWHRVSGIDYGYISNDLEMEFNLLHENNFVDVNIEEQDLVVQMLLLNNSEILKLCKKFKVPSISQSKSNLISSLIENCVKQKSAWDILCKEKTLSRLDMLKKEVKSSLGMCIKLNETVLSAFQKVFLLFSFPHYWDEEEKRLSKQLYMCLDVWKNRIKFPKYDLSPTVVFQCRNDFLLYESSLLMNETLENAMSSKSHENFFSIATSAKEQFQGILRDSGFQERFLTLPTFLRKFSAGSVYARILTKSCTNFKRKSDAKEVINITQMLLDQNLFLNSKRGVWYEILSQALMNLKDNRAAMDVLIKAQKDSFVDEVHKFALQLKGEAILQKNVDEFQNVFPMEELDLFNVHIQKPSSITIEGKLLTGNKSGYKSVFINESKDGTLLTSVEERALLHYESVGYTKGYHEENYIVRTVYILLFFDIIYGPSPAGAFLNAYQELPLDFYSHSFYSCRKKSIDLLLDEMCTWTKEEIEEKLTASYNKNFGVSCMINWEKNFTPQFFAEFLVCITMPVFLEICRRFIQNFKVYQSGFPDLTLLDPVNKKCKFVEVKGPKDKLSPAQKIWLNYLKENGADCEVCYVKSRRCNRPRRVLRLRTAGKRRQNFCQLHLERCFSEKHMTVVTSNFNGGLFVQKLLTN